MRYKIGAVSLIIASLLTGCASNKPFDADQIALIKQHNIVVESLPEDFTEPLAIYEGSDKVGSMMTGVAIGLLTGSYVARGDGNSPRSRLDSGNSTNLLLQNSQREAMAEKVDTISPTQMINDRLATHFERVEKGTEADMIVKIKPVAWHLFFSELFNQQETFHLEYASDVSLRLPAEGLSRELTCDKQSEQTLTQDEWLANDGLRIRNFAETLTSTCVNQVLTELDVATSIRQVN